MNKSQIVVLEVMFVEDDDNPRLAPCDWDWATLIDEPFTTQRVLASGAIVEYPRPTQKVGKQ